MCTYRFAIIKGPSRFWYDDDMSNIMTACVILHNMIIEDERDDKNIGDDFVGRTAGLVEAGNENNSDFQIFLQSYRAIRDTTKHYELRNDLVEHLWQQKGEMPEI